MDGNRTTQEWEKAQIQIIVIEQPELHLHPAYQAKLGELFAKVVASECKSKNC